MARQTFTMVNPSTGATATAYQGFSWTTLFFGPFPALLRADVIGALIGFALGFATVGLSWVVWPFFYNGWHKTQLSSKGYAVVAPAPAVPPAPVAPDCVA